MQPAALPPLRATCWRVAPRSPASAHAPRQLSCCSTACSASSSTDGPLTFDSPPHFADLPLDRAAGLRGNAAELQRLLELPTSKALLLHENKLLVTQAPSSGGSGASSGGSGSGAVALQPHCFAAAGAAAPGGAPPRFVPLVASSQQLLQQHRRQQEQEQQQQRGASAAQEQMEQPREGDPTFLFLGRDAAGEHVFAAIAPPHLLPLLPPVPPPRGAPADEPAAPAVEQQQQQVSAFEGARWVDVRNGGQQMTGPDAAVAAYAGERHSICPLLSPSHQRTLLFFAH